jgi:hypothetical protein
MVSNPRLEGVADSERLRALATFFETTNSRHPRAHGETLMMKARSAVSTWFSRGKDYDHTAQLVRPHVPVRRRAVRAHRPLSLRPDIPASPRVRRCSNCRSEKEARDGR